MFKLLIVHFIYVFDCGFVLCICLYHHQCFLNWIKYDEYK